ncbi:MAG TPA: RNA ligase [Oculatellaceae cyanobacterium]
MLKVQEYLLSHTLFDLEREHGVYARFSNLNPNKFTLNYDMFEARDGDIIAEECRGLILEGIGTEKYSSGPTRILAYPFRRFYNHGQSAAANINWKTAKFFEKLDGTLCIVYYDHTLGIWSVATRSVPDADLPFSNLTNKTFRQLFGKAVSETYFPSMQPEDAFKKFCESFLETKFTYMFELCTPENEPNCIRHTSYKAFLLGVRNNETLLEEEVCNLASSGLLVCPSYDLTPNSVFDFVLSRSHLEYEGLVVRDSDFNRIKIKNPEYVLASKIKDGAVKSPRSLLKAILSGKDDDIRPLLPESFKEKLDKIKDNLQDFLRSEEEWYKQHANPEGEENFRKHFAINVKQSGRHLPLQMFMFEKSEANAKTWIESKKNEDGTYSDAFLNGLLKTISYQ